MEYLEYEKGERKKYPGWILYCFWLNKSDLHSLGLSPDKMKNKGMLSLAEIPPIGCIIELLKSKFLSFLGYFQTAQYVTTTYCSSVFFCLRHYSRLPD